MSTNIYKRKIKLERIVLIGPMSEHKKWINWCYENNYCVKRTGPKPTKLARVDSKKFKIIAERCVV